MPEQDFYFNPFDPEFRANPYPHFPALLDGPPRKLKLFMPTTLIARYDDVVTVLHDHERFTVRRPEIPYRQRIDPFGGAPTILTAYGVATSYRMYRGRKAYRPVMEDWIWNAVLPGRILKMDHEDIVEDLDANVRRLLDFCGLKFEPACLDFHKTERSVRTASSEQV